MQPHVPLDPLIEGEQEAVACLKSTPFYEVLAVIKKVENGALLLARQPPVLLDVKNTFYINTSYIIYIEAVLDDKRHRRLPVQ